MHKLQRGDAPKCLAKYRHGLNNWGHLTHEDRTEIWQELDAMQGQRCAYCEDDISKGGKNKDEWMPLLQKELEAIRHLPFATAIKHTLLG